VYQTLATIRQTGTALLIVEQHVGQALAIADQVVVLTKGTVTFDGPVSDLGDLDAHLMPGGTAQPTP
ncbi:MAG TPA: ABC transporter ATP-binding protein, partial [Acidimicrobiia bacterium]|nr:ABC transporter ATP-binding protein [Acidimicrobiia bacterium]